MKNSIIKQNNKGHNKNEKVRNKKRRNELTVHYEKWKTKNICKLILTIQLDFLNLRLSSYMYSIQPILDVLLQKIQSFHCNGSWEHQEDKIIRITISYADSKFTWSVLSLWLFLAAYVAASSDSQIVLSQYIAWLLLTQGVLIAAKISSSIRKSASSSSSSALKRSGLARMNCKINSSLWMVSTANFYNMDSAVNFWLRHWWKSLLWLNYTLHIISFYFHNYY